MCLSILLFLFVWTTRITLFSVCGSNVVEFDTNNAKPATNLRDMNFVSRIQLPYGPDIYGDHPTQNDENDKPYSGYAFGIEVTEVWAYDTVNHYAYTISELGYMNIVDFKDPSKPYIFYQFYLGEEEVEDISICSNKGIMLLLYPEEGIIKIYNTITRSNSKMPELITFFSVGDNPVSILKNNNCTTIVVANENSGGESDDGESSTIKNDNEESDVPVVSTRGGVTVIRDLDVILATGTKSQEVKDTTIYADNGEWNDEYFLRKGLHMPLTRNALTYWDLYSPIADDIDLSALRTNYSPAVLLLPQSMAWSDPQEKEVLLSLQKNNGFLRINIETGHVVSAVGYGLIDRNHVPVDIQSGDKQCDLKTYPAFALRNPEGIRTLRYNDRNYLLTANSGETFEFEGFSEAWEAMDIFVGNQSSLPRMKFHPSVFDPSNVDSGEAAIFNSKCQGDQCVGKTLISVGSSAVDYETDPTNPEFQRVVMFGGRGWSIFEVPDDPDALLKLVYESGDGFERLSCEAFPWAYNGIIEAEYAPAEGMGNNTVWVLNPDLREDLIQNSDPQSNGCTDQGDGTPGVCPLSEKVDSESSNFGPQTEDIKVGVACGRLLAITVIEKTSILFVFDITNIRTPTLFKLIHLAPALRTKSPGLAFNDGSLGDAEPDKFIFLSASESPTGKAAIAVGGVLSGTISFWEFECEEEDQANFEGTAKSNSANRNGQSVAFFVLMMLIHFHFWL